MFRGFFGFPRDDGRGFGSFNDPFHSSPAGRDDGDDGVDTRHFDEFREPFDMFRHFEQAFEEMFKSFGLMDFPPRIPDNPGLQPLPDTDDETLRDRMLKSPERPTDLPEPGLSRRPPHGWDLFSFGSPMPRFGMPGHEPPVRKDEDLDEKVSSGDLSKFLEESPRREEPRSKSSFFFSSSARSSSVLSPSGAVEFHHTTKDSQGNEEKTVTRTLGDQSYAVTSRWNGRGEEERTESFTNMDQSQLTEFNQRWESSRSARPGAITGQGGFTNPRAITGPSAPHTVIGGGDPTYRPLFNKLFGSWFGER